MTDTERQADVVIVGAGMAGLVAAVESLQQGQDVVVLEKGTRAGGSMYLSAGIVYTYDSFERARTEIPHGDPDLQRVVVDNKDEAIEWLGDLGVSLREPTGDVTFGSGKQLDPRPFTDLMVDRIEEMGGDLHLDTPMTDLLVKDGTVVGVEADKDGRGTGRIDAESVILATGGFQGNERLIEQFVTDSPENLWLRANPWSSGDGLRAATDAGGKSTDGLGTFYGHNLPAPPAEIPPSQLLDAKQAYGVKAFAIDENGERFVDESASPYEVVLTQATAKRAGGRAYYVVDDELYNSMFASRKVSVSIQTAADLGGRVAIADSRAELESALFDWGVNGERALETLAQFNAALVESEGRRLNPTRLDHQTPIDEPPFHVVEVQPGITFTMGGIDVNADMEVLRGAGTSSMLPHFPEDPSQVRMSPIPGLYAAGADVGKIMYRQYMGGLAVALVTGRVAARNAAT